MLEALPQEEREYYSCESNVVSYDTFFPTIFAELTSRYGFVGGTEEEYIKYFHRQDMPANLWEWRLMEDTKAVAGFSAVPNKNVERQRKILMAVPMNYCWQYVSRRANHGLRGGTSLAEAIVPERRWSAATFDEESAFSMVAIPQWMMITLAGDAAATGGQGLGTVVSLLAEAAR